MQHWEMPGVLPPSLCRVSSSPGEHYVGEAAHVKWAFSPNMPAYH